MATLHEEPLIPAGRAIHNLKSLSIAAASDEPPDLEPLSPMSCIQAVIAIRGGLGAAAAEASAAAEAEAAALESLAEANKLEPKKLSGASRMQAEAEAAALESAGAIASPSSPDFTFNASAPAFVFRPNAPAFNFQPKA